MKQMLIKYGFVLLLITRFILSDISQADEIKDSINTTIQEGTNIIRKGLEIVEDKAKSSTPLIIQGPPHGLPYTIGTNDYGDVVNSTVTVEADGYYEYLNDGKNRNDSNSLNLYGKWFNTGISIMQNKGQSVFLKISGTVARKYETKFKFDPTNGYPQDPGIRFKTGDSLELSISETLPNGASATNYVNQGCDLFSNKAYDDDKGACNKHNVDNVCRASPSDENICHNEKGEAVGTWGIHGSGLSILYGGTNINDSNSQFSAQTSINPSIGLGGFFKEGFNIYNFTKDGLLSFKGLDSCNPGDSCWKNNIGNYGFLIRKIFNSIDNAQTSQNSYGTIDYTIYSDDPNMNNDPNKAPDYVVMNLGASADSYNQIKVNNSGTLWLKIHDNAPLPYINNKSNHLEQLNYFNSKLNNSFPNQNNPYTFKNIGRYIVDVNRVYTNENLSKLIDNIIIPIKEELNKSSKRLYTNIVSKQNFKNLVRYSLVLYIILYASMFIFGMVQVTQTDLVNRIFKMGILFALIATETSWNFFNNYLFNAFLNGNIYLIKVVTGTDPSTGIGGVFKFINLSLGRFFTSYTWLKISALMFNPVGIIVAIMMIYGIFVYALCMVEVIIGYLISLVAITFTIAIAPILLAAILFERTKTYFTNWINYLFNFSLQPVMLFGAIYLVYEMILLSFEIAISYRITWGCAIPVKIFFPFCIFWYKPAVGYSYLSIFIGVLMFMMFIKILKGMLDFAPAAAAIITQNSGAQAKIAGAGSQARGQIDGFKNLMNKALKLDQGSKTDRSDKSAASKESKSGESTPRPPVGGNGGAK